MHRRQFLAALAVVLGAMSGQADAAEGGGEKQVGQYVDLQPIGVPILADGRLINNVFVYVRMNLAPNADVSRWRAKEPYFRDALVRLAYATPLGVTGDNDKVDQAKLSAGLLRAIAGITGPGVVRSIVITKQTPSRHTSPARS